MPKPLVYNTGDEINLRATVIDGADRSRPVLDIGGFPISIFQSSLDKADHRDDSYREPTDAERDLAEQAADQEESARQASAEAERLAQAEAERLAEQNAQAEAERLASEAATRERERAAEAERDAAAQKAKDADDQADTEQRRRRR